MATTKKGKKTSTSKTKVKKVMHEFKEGALKSGSGGKVKSRKQAVAIGLSEARKAGAHIPRKKGAAKKASTKKASAKKSGAKKAATKRSK